MNTQQLYTKFLLSFSTLLLTINVFSQDPNFHIYLCFGQSNMEGQGAIETQDKTVNPRFQVMEAVTCTNLGRVKGSWYDAVPPLTRCWSGLSPADYFGRLMVETLPDSIKIGIINVSVAGCKIELFEKDNYQTYVSGVTEGWLKDIINAYGGNPYGHLIEVAKLAQKDGVIKGFLLHQGESNTGDELWPDKVKGVYNNLIADLSLNPDSVPLLAGEVVHADQGGICASMNAIIAKLPEALPNSYVISSSGCYDTADNLHFSSLGYRKLGRRYAVKMLSLLGYEINEPVDPMDPKGTESFFYEAECAAIGTDWDILKDTKASNSLYVMVKPEKESVAEAPGTEGEILVNFKASKDSTYYIFGRLNCPNANDDSFWIKMDDGTFEMANGLATSGWQWLQIASYNLTKGEHTFTIAYRENGAKLDKLSISNFAIAPASMGEAALNKCTIEPTVGVSSFGVMEGYTLENHPNPFIKVTKIVFEIPSESHVSVKIYNVFGSEVAELAGKKYSKGKHTVDFDAQNLSKGIYFYTLKTENKLLSRKMLLQSE